MARCFVIQGFGKKTDFTDGRVLDLDASYAVIKEAVEAAGFECLRADEIVHSGTIDQPMYEHLLRADLVIADLSTQNINAAFELGVRYGLRPRATIIVAEEGFKQAFDVSHLMIRRYKHLGEDIGRKEAARFQKELRDAMTEIVAGESRQSRLHLPEPAAAAARCGHGRRRLTWRPPHRPLRPNSAESQTAKVADRESAAGGGAGLDRGRAAQRFRWCDGAAGDCARAAAVRPFRRPPARAGHLQVGKPTAGRPESRARYSDDSYSRRRPTTRKRSACGRRPQAAVGSRGDPSSCRKHHRLFARDSP
jgi:hypothetical protein